MYFVNKILCEFYLNSFRVSVEFFDKVHAAFWVDTPVNNTIFQAHLPQMNCNNLEHAGPLGHDHAAHYQRRLTWITHVIVTFKLLFWVN